MSSLNQNVIRHKIGLLNLATELGNVSKACKVMGLSRDTFYRYQNAIAEGGVESLFDGNPRMGKCEPVTNCASAVFLFRRPAFAPSGCETTWPPSNSGYQPWRSRWPSKASC